ncbi:MAG: hypothetical protein MUO85_09405, partial [candidate division Zixibacteria bacterium]|nr:hypothetical protein [candidate division Zixibacteria bacterium]
GRIINYQNSILEYNKNRLEGIQRSYGFRKPLDLLNQKMQRTDELWRAFLLVIKNYFELKKKGLSLFFSQLNALSPLAVLERGYSITRKVPELSVVKDAARLKIEDEVEIKFHRGHIRAEVKKINQE